MAKNGELTSRQKRMITALLSSRNIGQACENAKVGRTTLARWLLDPDFTTALTAAEGQAIDAAARELLAGQAEALETIREVMQGYGGVGPAVRLRAADTWLGMLFKYRELSDLEERITKLESKTK